MRSHQNLSRRDWFGNVYTGLAGIGLVDLLSRTSAAGADEWSPGQGTSHFPAGAKRVLQIMAEPHRAKTMTVDDCADISRTISALLDVEDPIPGEYTLEVSSPGVDRPLVKRKDFERYAGYEIKLEASRTIDGRRRFRGRLKGLIDDRVCIEIDNGQTEISFADITKAKLVLTDDLLARQSSG